MQSESQKGFQEKEILDADEIGCLIIDENDFIPPSFQDFVLPDLTAIPNLKDSDISQALGAEYLGHSGFPATFPAHGLLWGPNQRLILNLPCQRVTSSDAPPALNVIFVISTLSPYTYLCAEAMNALIGDSSIKCPKTLNVKINSEIPIVVCISPEKSHFTNLNILGMDFMAANKVFPRPDFAEKEFDLESIAAETSKLKKMVILGAAAVGLALLLRWIASNTLHFTIDCLKFQESPINSFHPNHVIEIISDQLIKIIHSSRCRMAHFA